MKRLYCITGLPLSGKSSIAKAGCRLLADSKMISVGDIVRTITNVDQTRRAETTKADLFPDETWLRDRIYEEVERASEFHIFLEGMPRTGDQVNFIADKFWHYFPKILIAEVGDLITLHVRAKKRARDENDSDDNKFLDRLQKAAVNMADVPIVARQRMLPIFNVFTTGDDVAIARRLMQIKDE